MGREPLRSRGYRPTLLHCLVLWNSWNIGDPHFCITMDGEISDIVNIVLYTKRSVRRILVVVSRRILALLNDSC